MCSVVCRRLAIKTLGFGAGLSVLGWLPRRARSAPPTSSKPLTDDQRAALRGVIRDAIERKAIPGAALAVLSQGAVVFREGFGHVAFDAERPFTPDAPCFIASVTKPISATFFTSLDERGVVSLDDPVGKYLPEFKAVKVRGKGPATTTMRVWHLLSHRSGLPGNADLGEARPQRLARSESAEDATATGDYSLEQVIRRWIAEGLRAEPGARFAYGSSGYIVAARIAEVVMGKRYERLLQEGLLDPLGMTQAERGLHPRRRSRRDGHRYL